MLLLTHQRPLAIRLTQRRAWVSRLIKTHQNCHVSLDSLSNSVAQQAARFGLPSVEPRQRRLAPLQEPHRPHTQLPLLVQRQLPQPARTDGRILAAPIERRKARTPRQRVGYGGPIRNAEPVSPADSEA